MHIPEELPQTQDPEAGEICYNDKQYILEVEQCRPIDRT